MNVQMSQNIAERRVAFYPENDKTNAYISRMKGLISKYAKIEAMPSLKLALIKAFQGNFSVYDTVWFNFIENDFIKSNGKLAVFKTAKIFIKTFLISKLARRSVFVRHNHYPHATASEHAELLKRIIDVYERLFDCIITHSGAEAEGAKIYCPHPLYEIRPITKTPVLDYALPQNYFVVFGRIVRYKKIEELIKHFPDNQCLLIIGSVGDELYARELEGELDLKSNVIFKPGFIDDDIAQYLIEGSKGLVLSHSDDDMVVSGSFFYALSIHKKVFAVSTKFLEWVQPVVGEDMLHVEPDLPSLCTIISSMNYSRDFVKDDSNIIENFGDARVCKSIVMALGINDI